VSQPIWPFESCQSLLMRNGEGVIAYSPTIAAHLRIDGFDRARLRWPPTSPGGEHKLKRALTSARSREHLRSHTGWIP
jgi:hypothetical protein